MSDSPKDRNASEGLAPLSVVVDAALRVAQKRSERVVVVGGFVRDLLMRRSVGDFDLDLVVEGDGLAFSLDLQGELGGARQEFKSFLTSKLSAPFQCGAAESPLLSELDVATARSEEYTKPGALPIVKPTTVELDLWRRDFASNAMALPLAAYRDLLTGVLPHDALASRVVDPCGGLRDLKSATLRILHPQSFVDDPTRLFRAVRYAVRLSFHFDRETLSGFYEAVKSGALATLSPRRVWNEVVCALDEDSPAEVVQEFFGRGLFSHLPIVDGGSIDEVVEALARIAPRRADVFAEDYRKAGKLIILALLLRSGREDIALATSEGGRMIKRARDALAGSCSERGTWLHADSLAAFGLHGDERHLTFTSATEKG